MATVALGIAVACMDEANKYSKERKAFGKPLNRYQMISFKLADMMIMTDVSRLLIHKAAWAKEAKDPESATLASCAKLFASVSATQISSMAVQVFGQFRKFNQAYQAGQRKAADTPAEAMPVQEARPEYQGAATEPVGFDAQARPDAAGQVVTPEALEAARATLERPLIKPDPNAAIFTWLSLAMGFFGLFSLLALLGLNYLQGAILKAANVSAELFEFLVNVAFYFCLLGFATGLGSLLARHRFKGVAISGLVLGGLGIAIMITWLVLIRLGINTSILPA